VTRRTFVAGGLSLPLTRRAALAAAAAALLVRPARAPAADDDATVLIHLIGLEESAASAYRSAGIGPPVVTDEAAHAKALRTELQALGRVTAPVTEPSGVARRLADARGRARLDAAIALEGSLMTAYRAALLELQEPSILQTAGTILASHAQHRALLLRRAGRDPLGEQ
jgi:ferritin-like protein